MSVQVKRRREAASFLAGFVGAQAELIVDTTNNRVQVHDGITPGGFAAAKLGEVVTRSRTVINDSDYAVLPSDRSIAIKALTASRRLTLPAASAFPVGLRLLVVDESGACAPTRKITLAAAGADRINAAASVFIAAANGFLALESDGATKWTIVDQSTGSIGALLGVPTANFIFTPGGDGVVSFYRMDASRPQIPRTTTLASIAGSVVILSGANDAALFFGTIMAGVAYARIWNITKSPAQPARIAAAPAANQLNVTNAADIAGWSAGDTIQIGDPTAMHGGNNAVALDISPMQIAVLGMAFPQAGLMAKATVTGVGAQIALSGSATGGSFVALNCVSDGLAVSGMALVPCTVPSPISNSNLVFVRETVSAPNTLGVALFSSLALFG